MLRLRYVSCRSVMSSCGLTAGPRILDRWLGPAVKPQDDMTGPHNDRVGPHNDRVGPHNDRVGPHNDRVGPHNDRAGCTMT
jgi:hypothetical protein